MLNLLQRACGIATVTRAYVDALRGTSCRILHTRKTAPGLRALDVAAVIAGGGQRHRVDLAHEVMVKDNHWQAVGKAGLGHALAKARKRGRDRPICGSGIHRAAEARLLCRSDSAPDRQPVAGDGGGMGAVGARAWRRVSR